MSKRWTVSAVVMALIATVVLGTALWFASRSEEPESFCEEAEAAGERIDDIEGPGYDKGLESLEALRRAAQREEPADQEFVTVVDRLSPLLEQVSSAYDSGGYEAVDVLPRDTLDEFEQLTAELDAAMEERCPSVVGSTPPSPDSPPPQPTMVEVTTTTTD